MIFGVHAMIWVSGWSVEEAQQAISAASRVGYGLIEIPLFDPENADTDSTTEILRKHNMSASISLGLSRENDISSQDLSKVQNGAKFLQKALSVCAEVGSDYLGGAIFSALRKYSSAASSEGRANSAGVIRELAQDASRAGITIGIEPTNRYENNLLNTAEAALRFADEVNEDNVCVHLDTFHMNIEEADPCSAIELCGDRLGYFHVNESHRGYLGAGNIEFSRYFRSLARIGYNKPIAFEAFSSSVTSEELGAMAGIWRDIWTDSDDIATHALSTMKLEYENATRAIGLARRGRLPTD